MNHRLDRPTVRGTLPAVENERAMRSAPLVLGVLASGRGSNLQAILDAIDAGRCPARVAVVVSDRKDAPALERARRAGIRAVHVDPRAYADRVGFDDAIAAILDADRVELVCLAGYMRVLSAEFVRHYPSRILNVHPALLPAFPGLHAQRQALDGGVKVTGATVHFVDEGVDTGRSCSRRRCPCSMTTPRRP